MSKYFNTCPDAQAEIWLWIFIYNKKFIFQPGKLNLGLLVQKLLTYSVNVCRPECDNHGNTEKSQPQNRDVQLENEIHS